MKVKKGDKVKILVGKDKGVQGNVVRVFPKINKLVVEGVNKVKVSSKRSRLKAQKQGIIEIEKPINASNVQVVNPETGKPSRIENVFEGEKKVKSFKK